MTAVAGEPIDAGPNEEVRAQIVREAEQFIDVAFTIADMNTTVGLTQALNRLPEILEPANAFLLLDGNTGRIDVPFERGDPFEFLARPEFYGRQSQRQSTGRHGKAGMHHHSADSVMAKAPALVSATVDAICHADQIGCGALVRELCGVLDE